MAEWIQKAEPYIRVQERVRTTSLNPTAGDGLIIGCSIIADCGPATPTLITSQSDFIKMYASQELTEGYLDSLNRLYTGSNKSLAATMWANAYRLVGSNSLLVTRASAAEGINYVKPLITTDKTSSYILRDGELLKKMPAPIEIALEEEGDEAMRTSDGWAINVNGVGVIGNLNTDEGAIYDYFVKNLPDLISQLNETSKFFCPDYTLYKGYAPKPELAIDVDENDEESKDSVKCVVLNEVYLAANFLDTTNELMPEGKVYLQTVEPDYLEPSQHKINLVDWTNFNAEEYYAINVYNSASNLRVRIRRFNHDAVVNRPLSENALKTLTETSASPYGVLKPVLDTYTKNGLKEPSSAVKKRDFFEVAIFDPSTSDTVSFFNVGNIPGRGDIDVSELNDLLKMIQLELPYDLHDLGLNYWGYDTDNCCWAKIDENDIEDLDFEDDNYLTELPEYPTLPLTEEERKKGIVKYEYGVVVRLATEFGNLTGGLNADGTPDLNADGTAVAATAVPTKFEYYVSSHNGQDQAWADLTINPASCKILAVSDASLKKALDLIELDEVYTTEGLCDLGNTELSYQSYMANMAINSNYFYPISTAQSTNYMTIGNFASKIPQESYKLYMSAPWDIDSSTLGWKYLVSPSVLYWEAVARNRRNNQEFRGVFGQVGGIVSYQKPLTEFNKKTRQLLLSKNVNTVTWNIQTQAWNLNDNYTKQSEDTIMSDEGNSRLGIRISKAIPTLLKQYIGQKITERLCTSMRSTIDYFFKTVIQPMEFTTNGYQIFCDYDEDLARQNKVKVVINVRFDRSLKYVNVVNNFFDVGMDISSSEE